MPFIIDGHNLIPWVPGLSLDEIDDEIRLVELLQEFCRRERKRVEVYFDRAAPGGSRLRKFGNVTARFVRHGRTADEAISEKLRRLAGEARNYTVVSSDHSVQAAARAARARVLTSADFVGILLADNTESSNESESANKKLSQSEVDEWLDIFNSGGEK
ncbi:MAG: NYN domain-containing protein [Anaerolineales bacterium]|jgi:predicted RNA-binding protein with PIN domain